MKVKPMKNVIGIDPSLTSTGVCYGTGAKDWTVKLCKSKPSGTTVSERVKRYEGLVSQIDDILQESAPVLIFIEGYSYGSKTSGMTQAMITEVGSLIRWHLVDQTPHIYEVAPSTLKKFATGKGNSKKEQVIGYVQKHWGQLFDTSDQADAFVLYRMALCAAGRVEPSNQAQQEAVSKVLEQRPFTAGDLRNMCGEVDPDTIF